MTDGDRAELHAAARPWGSWSEERANRILEAAVETIVARHVDAALHPARPRRLCEAPPTMPEPGEVTVGNWTFTPRPTAECMPPLGYLYSPDPDPEPDPWAPLRNLAPGERLPVYDRDGQHVADAVAGVADELLTFTVQGRGESETTRNPAP